MKKKILVLSMVVALVAALVVPTAALADNQAGQGASTASATTINIVDKVGTDAITTITFPEGAPSATISDPYNDVNGIADSQFLDAAASEPVVRLNNTSGGTLTVSLEITSWSGGVVDSEEYELVTDGSTTVNAVTLVLSSDGSAATVNTSKTIADAAFGALYLEVTLSSLAGASGTSILTILGES